MDVPQGELEENGVKIQGHLISNISGEACLIIDTRERDWIRGHACVPILLQNG